MSLDVSALIDIVGDDEATIQRFLLHFLHNAEEDVAAILEAHNNRSSSDLAAASHRLKSSARTVGATELADLCYELEMSGKNEEWNTIDNNIDSLSPLFNAVKEYINSHYAK